MKKKILTFILTAFVVVNTSHYAFAGVLDEECTECSKTQNGDGYWEDLLSAELHNWRILREIPTVFESDSWKTYYELGPAIPNIDPSNIDEKSQDKLTKQVSVPSCFHTCWKIQRKQKEI